MLWASDEHSEIRLFGAGNRILDNGHRASARLVGAETPRWRMLRLGPRGAAVTVVVVRPRQDNLVQGLSRT